MQVFMDVLFFVLGALVTVAALLTWAWYLNLQERILVAETARKNAEETLKQIDEQQKEAQLLLEQTIADMVKRRRQSFTQQPVVTTSPQLPSDSGASLSVKERLRKAVELTAKQAKIDTRKGPDFILEHNELELEKLSVLKTILADGFDPLITIRYSSGEQEMLLSTYVQSISKALA